jgi:hypothetical protein
VEGRANKVINWKELTYGVEIELTFINREGAALILCEHFQNGGYEQLFDHYDTYEITDNLGRVWRVMYDASIEAQKKQGGRIVSASDNYKCELVTPILTYDDITTLQEIVRRLRKAGANTNSSTGIHVHIGAEHFKTNVTGLRNLANQIYSKQLILQKSLQIQESRKRYCKLLPEDFIIGLNKIKPKTLSAFADIWYNYCSSDGSSWGTRTSRNQRYHPSRYHLANFHPILSGRMPTIELRCFNGSLHAGVVKSYIQFSLKLVEKSLNQTRTSYKITYTDNEKYSVRVWLLSLGFIGDEYKTARLHLTKLLTGDSAWRRGKKVKQEECPF